MAKKWILGAALAFSVLILSGCSGSLEGLVKNNMAERTEQYFYGENSDFSLSISVGMREQNYMIDGHADKLTGFSLLTFKDKTATLHDDEISCMLTLDGNKAQVKLQYNPIADRYMFDLGYKIAPNTQIEFEFNGISTPLACQSDNFFHSWQDALKVATKHFESTLKKYKSDGRLLGECYLKVMGQKDDQSLYWTFTFVTQEGQTFNLIISTIDGKIIASDQTL